MKTQIINIINSIPVLQKLENVKTMKVTTSFKILKIEEELDAVLQKYEKIRKKMIDENTKRDEQGNLVIVNNEYQIMDERKDKFEEEYQELLKMEIDIDIPLLKLSEMETISLSAVELKTILFLIEF